MLSQVLGKISQDSRSKEIKQKIEEAISNQITANECWPIFQLSLKESSNTINTLSAMHKLTAGLALTGSVPGDPLVFEEYKVKAQEFGFCGNIPLQVSEFNLIDEIMFAVFQLALSRNEQDLQLQVLQLFLTTITAQGIHMHAYTLAMIYRISFLIHAISPVKSNNEITAKACLTQGINLIFTKLERFGLINPHLTANEKRKSETDETLEKKELERKNSESLERSDVVENEEETVSSKLHIEPSVENLADIAKEEANQEVAKSQSPQKEETHHDDGHSPEVQYALLKRDVQLTLLFLCHYALSSDKLKNDPSTFNPDDINDLTNPDELSATCVKDRSMALELIQSVFNNLGPVFRKDPEMFKIVKENVSNVISKNAITTNPTLFEASLAIFILLIKFYRHKLKMEIEVLLGIYFQILEMGNSTYKQKSIILQRLLYIAENPQILMDIYMNYDCEFEMVSLTEKMISICSKTTQGRDSLTASSIFGESKLDLIRQQEKRLHLRSLCILSAVIESLVKWSKDLTKPAAVSTKLDEEPTSAATDTKLISTPKDDVSDQVEQIASKKQQFRQFVKIFNTKPQKGMNSFIHGGFVENNVQAIATFLQTTTELSKGGIGEYLGEGSPFNIQVMHAFIDAMNFTNMDIVAAIRQFLQAFRLPGEAQKIDRMMEKFADRYCECNPTIFARADTAYTLAFSIIMLNTDQHSPQIKHRMDAEKFIKNNRGINDDGDLPDEFLTAIFNEIHDNEIIMEDERSDKLAKIAMGWGAGEATEKQRMEIFKKEASIIQKKTQQLMLTGNKVVPPFKTAKSKELARPLFATCSWALMAALSLSFEAASDAELSEEAQKKSKEPNVANLCLAGLTGGIKLACMFKLETERDAFVTSLAKLTSLTDFYNIKPKNIKAINALIELATSQGDYLDSAWIEIMKTLSQLERMQVSVLQGEEVKAGRISQDENRAGYQELAATQEPKRAISKTLEKYVQEIQSQTSLIFIDRIFTTSVNLSATAIVYFFKAVCEVSLEEVYLSPTGVPMKNIHGPPRMYLLQKIVEIAYYNMHRIRFEWTQIWRLLQPHFNKVACHPNQRVATYAVDSLRQLGVKFLEREELGQFSSQHEFLKSFEWIIKHNQSPSIRELILNSLAQMITARASRIRSGWKSIFVTLVKAAQADEKTAHLGFQTIQMVFTHHFEEVVAAGGFVDLVSCLAECALLAGSGPAHDELVMSSIQMLQSCTKSLVERAEQEATGKKKQPASAPVVVIPTVTSTAVLSVQPHTHTPRINNLPQQPYLIANGCIAEEHYYLSWFPILSAFSRVVTESEGVLVRTHTMEILFETIKTSGHLFDAPYWKSISRNIISPIFTDLSDPEEASLKESNSAVLILGLRLLVQMVSYHFEMFKKLSQGEDKSSIEFLYLCVDRMVEMMVNQDDKLANTGQTCFSQFLITNAGKFAVEDWDWLIEKIGRAFQLTLPSELIKCHGPSNNDLPVPPNIVESALNATNHMETISLDSLDFERTVIKCVTHLELLSTIKEFCLHQISPETSVLSSMPIVQRSRLLEILYSSYAIARLFNSFTSLRQAIYKRGWVSQLPNLVKQETTSLSTFITLLFLCAKVGDDSEILGTLDSEINDLSLRLTTLLASPTQNQRDIVSWCPIVIVLYREICAMDRLWEKNSHGTLNKERIYNFAIKMLEVDRPDVRGAIIEYLKKVGTYVFQ
ncbi:Protein transport protein sec71 [Boothiomyces sp. JEL0866]|nr:Protein transport protein sec71 [Boothiomyces sp. JEL0866]